MLISHSPCLLLLLVGEDGAKELLAERLQTVANRPERRLGAVPPLDAHKVDGNAGEHHQQAEQELPELGEERGRHQREAEDQENDRHYQIDADRPWQVWLGATQPQQGDDGGGDA